MVVLQEFELLRFGKGPDRELFAGLDKAWSPSNAQFTVAGAAFLAYCAVLLRHLPGKVFASWLAIGIYVFYTGLLALCGLKEWINQEEVAWALACYFLPCLLLWAGSLARDRRNRRGEAAALYAFVPVPFVLLMTLLAYHGSVEWFHVDIKSTSALNNETINLWWMLNGLTYAFVAMLHLRCKKGFIRFWSTFFAVLVPISVLLPCNLLFDQGWPVINDLGGKPLRAYELLGGLAAIGFVVLGTMTNRITLSLPGLVGLAVVVFRFTARHYPDETTWPMCVALVGGVAMLAGVVSAVVRARSRERGSLRR